MKLKIGDKVRIIKFPDYHWVGAVGIVIGTPNYPDYPYEISSINNKDWTCLMRADEIEKISTKGEQLLFSFMDAI